MKLRTLFLATSAVVLASCGGSGPAGAQDPANGALSDPQFKEQLRRVLVENPEIILEAIETYRSRLQQEARAASEEAIKAALPDLIAGETGTVIGASANEADLVIVEFFDYHCGFCRQAVDDVMDRAADNAGLRVVLQEMPILRPESRDAALLAMAAAKVDEATYRAVHTSFMKHSGVLDDDGVAKSFRRAGIKEKTVRAAYDEHLAELEMKLDQSVSVSRELGVEGTPFFIVYDPKTENFDVLEGYRQDMFDQLIEDINKDA